MDSLITGRCKWLHSKIVRLLLACVVSGVMVVALSGAAVFKYNIVIEDEGKKTIVYTSEDEPAKVLAAEGISLGAHDQLVVEEDSNQQRNIVVKRASYIRVTADGTTRGVWQVGGTVSDALDKLGITINEDDYVNVLLNEPVCSDMEVEINRVTRQTVERLETIPFSVVTEPTQTLKNGASRILSEGENGQRTVTVEQVILDGEVIEETVVSEAITKQPVAARVLVGDPNAPVSELIPDEPVLLDGNGNPIEYKQKITGRATAYSALGKKTKLVPGAVAMDLSKFPRFTQLYIKTPDGSFTYGYSEVRDTGYAVQDGTCLVDLFFDTYEESCLFGVKTVDIYIL